MRKSLAKKLVDKGWNDSKIIELGARGIFNTGRGLQSAAVEGSTEYFQSVWQNTIQKGYERNLGENEEEIITAFNNAFKESWLDKQALEEGYAGVSTGLLQLFGLRSKVSRNLIGDDVTSSEISDLISENEEFVQVSREEELRGLTKPQLKKIASELNIPGRTNIGKEAGSEPLINAILNAEKEIETTEDESTVETPEEIPSEDKDLTSRYIDAIIEPEENMQDVLDEASLDDSPSSKSIIKANNIVAPGKKILSMILDNVGIVDKILESKNADQLLYLAREEYNNSIDESPDIKEKDREALKLGRSKSEIVDALRDFNKRGKIKESNIDEQDPSDMGMDVGFEIVPDDIGTIIIGDEEGSGTSDKGSKYVGDDGAPSDDVKLEFGKKGEMDETSGTVSDQVKKAMEEEKAAKEQALEDIKVEGKEILDDTAEETDEILETGEKIAGGKPVIGENIVTKDSDFRILDEKGAPVEKKAEEAPVEEESTTDEDIQIGTEIDINKDLVGNTNLSSQLKTKMNKISKGSWKVIKETEKAWKVQNQETNEKIDVPKTLELKDKTRIPSLSLAKESKVDKESLDVKPSGTRADELRKLTNKQLKELISDINKNKESDKKIPISGVKASLVQRIIENEIEEGKPAPKIVSGVNTDEVQFKIDNKTKQPKVTFGGESISLEKGEVDAYNALQERKKKLEEGYILGGEAVTALTKYQEDVQAWKEAVIARVKVAPPTPQKEDTKSEAKKAYEEAKKKTANKDLDAGFQTEQTSKEILISEDTKLAEKILSRLKKHFPFVDVKTFQGVLTMYGKRRIGFAMERIVAWSTTDGRMDTMPHEYAHIYIKLFRNDPLVKKALKQFKSEEELVKYIGLYYTNRARTTSLGKRVKIWLKQFVNRLRRYFGKDVKDLEQFIAEEFYQGRYLGAEAVVGDQFIDFMDEKESEEDAFSGDEVASDFTNTPSDHQITSMYKDALGIYLDKKQHYPAMHELARKTKTFDEYLTELQKWAEEIVDKRQFIIKGKPEKVKNISKKIQVNGREVYEMQQKEPYLFNELSMDWLKALVKRQRFNIDDPSTRNSDSRVFQQLVVDGKTINSKGDGITLTSLKSRITGKKFSSNVTSNFFEEQEGTQSRLQILPVKEIARTNVNKETKERFWTRANYDFSMGNLLDLEMNLYPSQYENQVENLLNVENIGTKKSNRSLRELITEPWMSAIVGSKLGDNAALLSTIIPKEYNPLNITPDSFLGFFKSELDLGNITKENYDDLTLSLETVAKKDIEAIRKAKNPLINSTLEDYIDIRKKDKVLASKIVSEVKGYLNEAITRKAGMSQIIGKYIAWQEIRTPDYLLWENSVEDSMTRLSIDLAEGILPRGLKDTGLMIIPTNAKVMVKVGDKWEKAGTYDDFDGTTFTAGRMLKKLGKILGGTGKITQLKTFIRQRDVNPDNPNKVDYIGMKHMQFSPHKNMRFYDPNTSEMIAEVTGSGMNTVFKAADGTKFDMIASPNEAKMMYGKYTDQDGKLIPYKIHTINEKSIKIHDVQRASKKDASFPIALGEMILASAAGQNPSKEAKALIKEIEKRYGESANHYMQKVNSIFNDSSSFNKFIQTEAKEGNVPTELHKYLSFISENGLGIWHPALIKQIIPIINNKLVKNGLFKARALKGTASKVYLKPAVHLPIDKGSVMISSDNSVAVNQVEKAYREKNKITGKSKDYWEKEAKNNNEKNIKHFKMKTLNEFLENNEINVLIHRNPIQKTTGVVLRRVQRIHEGGHGESMFLSFDDVKKVLDGDWDGDTAQFEFVSESYSNAMKNWQKSKEYARIDSVISVDIFADRTDKQKEGKRKTSVVNLKDRRKAINQNAKLDGSTGFFVNAKTIMSQLFYKDFKLFHEDLKDIGGYLRPKNPDAEVVMDYAPLKKENLLNKIGNKTLYQQILDNGDKVVTKKEDGTFEEIGLFTETTRKEGFVNFPNDIYLQTTVSNEISTLFQMAVDAGKYDIFGKILNDSKLKPFEFMLTKLFEVADKDGNSTGQPLYDKNNMGEKFASKMIGMLSLVYSAQNISQRRAGINKESSYGRAADFDTNVSQSEQLYNRHNLEGKLRTDEDFSNEFFEDMSYKDQNREVLKYDSSLHGDVYGKKISMKNKITPGETLVTSLWEGLMNTDFYKIATNINAQKHAHVLAVNELIKTMSSMSTFGEFINGKLKKDYIDGWNFLFKKEEFNGNQESFISAWENLKDKTSNMNNIQSDLNEDFIAFTDRYIEQWNLLSEPAQIFATFKMITGSNKDIHVLKLPPLALMNDGVIKQFLPMFEKHLRNQKADISDSQAQDVRQNAEYLSILNNITNTYQQYDDVRGVCKLT